MHSHSECFVQPLRGRMDIIMCGRYSLYDDDDYFEIFSFLNELRKKYPTGQFSRGEVFPSSFAPVLVRDDKDSRGYTPEIYLWGIPGFDSKGVIINARSETVAQKRTFSSSFSNRRCIIPSTGFYEWSKDTKKKKFHFSLPDEKTLFMAGVYSVIENVPKFVILTRDANDDVSDIHNRMPVILDRQDINFWLRDNRSAVEILEKDPPELFRKQVS